MITEKLLEGKNLERILAKLVAMEPTKWKKEGKYPFFGESWEDYCDKTAKQPEKRSQITRYTGKIGEFTVEISQKVYPNFGDPFFASTHQWAALDVTHSIIISKNEKFLGKKSFFYREEYCKGRGIFEDDYRSSPRGPKIIKNSYRKIDEKYGKCIEEQVKIKKTKSKQQEKDKASRRFMTAIRKK